MTKKEIKEVKTIEERYEEHLKLIAGSVCYGYSGCEFGIYGLCPTYEMEH